MSKKPKVIEIKKLPIVSNICNQLLREVWQNKDISITHVYVKKNGISLLHSHKKFTELYYFINGTGRLEIGSDIFRVRPRMIVEIPPNTPHRLKNTGKKILEHLVISNPPFSSKDVKLLE